MSDGKKINRTTTKPGTVEILGTRLMANIIHQVERTAPTNISYTERTVRPLWRSLALSGREWLRGYGPAQWICDFCGAFVAGKLDTKHATTTPEGITAKVIMPDHGPIRLRIEASGQSLELTKIEAMHVRALLGRLLSACQWPVMGKEQPLESATATDCNFDDEIPF